jgi:hypothetical protein
MSYNKEEYKQYSCINLSIPKSTHYDDSSKSTWSPESLYHWKEMAKTAQGCLTLLQNQALVRTPVSFSECSSPTCIMSRAYIVPQMLRFELASFVNKHIIARPSQDDNKPFTYWSLGSGGLFQDMLLIQNLMLGPNQVKTFDFVFVDDTYQLLFDRIQQSNKIVEESNKMQDNNVEQDHLQENKTESKTEDAASSSFDVSTSVSSVSSVSSSCSNSTAGGSKSCITLDKDQLISQFTMSKSTIELIGDVTGFNLLCRLGTIQDEVKRDAIYRELLDKRAAEKQLQLLCLVDFVRAHGGIVRSIRLFQSLSDYFKMCDQVPDIRGDLCVSSDLLDDRGVAEFQKMGHAVQEQYFTKLDMAKHESSPCLSLHGLNDDYCFKITSKSHTWVSYDHYLATKKKQTIRTTIKCVGFATAAIIGALIAFRRLQRNKK